MPGVSKGIVRAIFLSCSLSGCAGVNVMDYIRTRENDLPEVAGTWQLGDSRRQYVEVKVHSYDEIYVGWSYLFNEP